MRAIAADRAAGVVVALFGAWFLWQAFQFREGPGFAVVGPRVFPAIVGIGLTLSGLALAVLPGARAEAETPTDWRTLLLMAAALAVYVALYLPLGFPIASVAFSSLAHGSSAVDRPFEISSAACCWSLVVYLVFTQLLTIDLPAGPLEGFL